MFSSISNISGKNRMIRLKGDEKNYNEDNLLPLTLAIYLQTNIVIKLSFPEREQTQRVLADSYKVPVYAQKEIVYAQKEIVQTHKVPVYAQKEIVQTHKVPVYAHKAPVYAQKEIVYAHNEIVYAFQYILFAFFN